MKKPILIPFLLLLMILSTESFSQSQADIDFFAGKWSVLVKGTPNGDSKMVFMLDKNDATLTGVIQDTTGVEISKMDKVEILPGKMTVYFNAQGFDVDVTLNKKDDDHLTGSLMGMFTTEAERKKK